MGFGDDITTSDFKDGVLVYVVKTVWRYSEKPGTFTTLVAFAEHPDYETMYPARMYAEEYMDGIPYNCDADVDPLDISLCLVLSYTGKVYYTEFVSDDDQWVADITGSAAKSRGISRVPFGRHIDRETRKELRIDWV